MDTNKYCYPLGGLSIATGIGSEIRARLGRLIERLLFWAERAAQRRQLAQLEDRMLKDVGLNRADAFRESGKWFWQD